MTDWNQWTVTVLDYNGIPVAAERDYGPNLEGHVSRFLGLYNWTLKIKGEPGPTWWGQSATLEQAEMDADRVAESDLVQNQVREWVERPIEQPSRSGHQSTLRIQEYRRPR